MRREVPVWLAVVIVAVVLVIIVGAYVWLSSPRRQEGGMITKPPATVPPATVIPSQGEQGPPQQQLPEGQK